VIGDTVFVDANIFINHFTNHPKFGTSCTRLLERIELKDFHGFTASNRLADVAHRVMTIEAMGRMGWPATSLAARLKKHHAKIPKMSLYQQATAKVGQLGIHVLAISEQLVLAAMSCSQQYELLIDDALIVAVMHDQGLTKIASHDADFDRVPGLTRYGPA
jgi:predicted nucleic acid-binding protein